MPISIKLRFLVKILNFLAWSLVGLFLFLVWTIKLKRRASSILTKPLRTAKAPSPKFIPGYSFGCLLCCVNLDWFTLFFVMFNFNSKEIYAKRRIQILDWSGQVPISVLRCSRDEITDFSFDSRNSIERPWLNLMCLCQLCHALLHFFTTELKFLVFAIDSRSVEDF